jgi:galactokinase
LDMPERIAGILKRLSQKYGDLPHRETVVVSAPGRIEIGGNHTDHQHGCVISASINLDTLGVAAANGTQYIRLSSEGYPENVIDIGRLDVAGKDVNTTAALVRGVADGFVRRGLCVGGFDACVTSEVIKGAGLSSSASFEVWLGYTVSELFNGGGVSLTEIAQTGQYAENAHFGKPCGLQDQLACATGGVFFMDFKNPQAPLIEKIDADLPGYSICVIDSGADHSNLTEHYAAIPCDLGKIAAHFGKTALRDVEKAAFVEDVPELREKFGDRAVLRAFHIFEENTRVLGERKALCENDREAFFSLVKASGRSSFMYLQNVVVPGSADEQALAVALAACEELLHGEGAFRIQGGGFAGTVEAFVPAGMATDFSTGIEKIFGKGSCHILSVRADGVMRVPL